MGKIVSVERDICQAVPEEVKNRVRRNLEGREIDFSDIPESSPEQLAAMCSARKNHAQAAITITVDASLAQQLTSMARKAHETVSEFTSEMLRRELAYA
jgi:hypothetical protein